MMEIRFDGEIALVTGAASGIGRALATGFAQSGADVVLCDVRGEVLEATAAEIRAGGGGRVWAHVLDVADRAACRALAAEVQAQAGAIHHLVNCAGIDPKGAVGTPEGDLAWDRIMAVNAGGVHNMCAAFVDQLVRNRGTILNVGSTMAFVGQPRMTAYTASKALIHNYTQSLAAELAPQGVRVNMLAPGVMNGGLTAGLVADPVRLQPFLDRTCLGRTGTPQEMVGPALMACSRHGSYMTGATVLVDGGWLAR